MLRNYFQEWTKPAGLVVILGFVIWLVQLNLHALQSTKKNSEQDIIIKELRYKLEAHNIEAEKWKERIRQNSERSTNPRGE